MGERQRRLAQLLGSGLTTLPPPRHADIAASACADAVYKVYTDLGGIQTQELLKTRVGAWDMQYNEMIVELDEELHFNRYRAKTLISSIYKLLPNFPLSLYQGYCTVYERACFKAGSKQKGKWTNSSCEKQFGTTNELGNLEGNGAPRWKQRAFYDFVRDLAPLVFGFKVVRIAIWDTLLIAGQQVTVEKALKNPDGSVYNAVIELIKRRSYETLPPKV